MRILPPEEFGIIAKILIVLTFFNVFLDLGYSQAIIQQKETTRASLSSHFYLGTFIGLLLGIILFVSSPFIARYFSTSELELPFKLFSITLFIGGTVLVHRSLLFKEMQFKKLALIDTSSLIITGIIAIYLAKTGFGFKAIVFQLFCNSILQAILYWSLSSFRPVYNFNYSDIKKTSKFSSYIFFTELINYVGNILDQFLTALYFNNTTLGLYNRSISLIKNTSAIIPSTNEAVLFPLFSKLEQGSNTAQNEIYIRTSSMISFIFTPLLFIYFFFAEHFVQIILGQQWLDIIPYTKILSLVAILIVTRFGGSLLMSNEKTKELFYMNFVNKSIIIVAIIISIQFGLIQVLWSIFIAELLIRIFNLFVYKNLLGFNIKKYIQLLLPPLIIGFVVAFSIYLLSLLFPTSNWAVVPVLLIYTLYIFVSTFSLNTQYAKDSKLLFNALIKSFE